MATFEARMQQGPPLVADGGMGALVSAAVPGLRCPEEANLRAPESIVSVHVAYIRAGADLIETNTFGANRPKLAQQFLEDDFERINSTAVRLAREAREVSGKDVFIAGSIGPLGDVELREETRAELFAEQARVLEGRGVDLFMVETFYDLEELETAIEAVRSVSSLPVVALMTFDEEAQTLAGVSAAEAGRRLRPLGLAAIGANHGAGPAAALGALAQMRGDGTVLAALPNVGLASLSGSRIVYPHASPEYFGEFAAQARELGAGLIGGCCGTTPAQIEAIRAAIDEGRAAAGSIFVDEGDHVPPPPPVEAETRLAQLLQAGEFVVSVQLDPPLGGNNAALLEAAEALRRSEKAHVVDVNDNPRARASMSGIMASVAIERATGVETIPHLTPRDSTIVGLESLLLGAHAEGVRNVLCVTGDPPEEGDYPGAGGVYQVDAIGLVEIVSRLNRGEDWHGREIDAPTAFFPGVAVNPSADDLDTELRRFERKIAAGARFAMTQVLFDLDYLDRFVELLGGASPIPLLVGVWPLSSHALAVRIHNEVPGIVVPEPVQERLRAAGANAAEVGMELARELLAESRGRAAGAYVVAPFRRPLGVLDLLG
ncbi:MAG TPA: bifunctional homocysteine S-methyltransferase/methylenetetrahydrofolate reductase [Gaiellaceae bacterium]|nr:bifunctional homocysteine S-methyltransferase/methylenetetrahydrofolate reductase [Gaiellaceae bacterium]